MKKQLFILYVLLLLILSHTAWAQDWTVPVNVSNTNDMILFSDFTIDNNGIIHCVWNLKYNSNYGVIFYSYSEDDGNSWFEPISISQNVSNYCTSPYIIHDSQNNLYVGYDLNNYDPPPNWGSWSCLAIKDSSGWGQPFTISEGISTRLAVDNNDRVYVFWFMGAPHNGEFYYQYLEDEIWSGVFCPYDNDELTGINEIAVDENNSLHCAGYHDSTGFLDVHPAYLRYEYESNQWGNLMDFTEKESISDIDIVLDTNWLPHICWGGDALYYSFYDGNQ